MQILSWLHVSTAAMEDIKCLMDYHSGDSQTSATHTQLCSHVFLTIYSPEDDKTCHSVKKIENGTAILEQTNILSGSNVAMQIILCHFSKTISDCTCGAEQKLFRLRVKSVLVNYRLYYCINLFF